MAAAGHRQRSVSRAEWPGPRTLQFPVQPPSKISNAFPKTQPASTITSS